MFVHQYLYFWISFFWAVMSNFTAKYVFPPTWCILQIQNSHKPSRTTFLLWNYRNPAYIYKHTYDSEKNKFLSYVTSFMLENISLTLICMVGWKTPLEGFSDCIPVLWLEFFPTWPEYSLTALPHTYVRHMLFRHTKEQLHENLPVEMS